ncbi:hypothetical protein EHP00_1215 [Ecytonucleospora hepatopenaei]|uniref:Nudix hydrolase domain-containing protein n=1 Tax=Ecytonucleospora hepatopenaei TaxID=646526 RepID=A0A1W0E820_9MICR|nr:hypothetical protein EHP00_1215 [Ecytonucleospora hepatopenaei]
MFHFLSFLMHVFSNKIEKEIEKTAGCIPFYENKIVMITSSKGNVIFPKGHIKKNESAKEAAVRETEEECGCIGEIFGNKIEIERVKKDKTVEHLSLFKMKVKKIKTDFDEKTKRKIIFKTKEELLKHKHIPKYLLEIIRHEIN